MTTKKTDKEGLFRSIFIAYMILLLHVVLLAGVGVTMLLFKGVYQYLHWIMAGLAVLVLGIAWIFYRRMRASSADIKSILSAPEFKDRSVEIRLLGGFASFKINAAPNSRPQIEHHPGKDLDPLLLENGTGDPEQRLLNLTALYEKNLITREEFETAKMNILQG